MDLSIDVTLKGKLDPVIEQVTEALKAQGFGILTRIDVDKTLKTKIGADFRPYVILGACNPGLAHQAISARPDVGLMLPCNVVVDQTGTDECLVRFIDPGAMMQFGDLGNDKTLARVGAEAKAKIELAAASLG
ncbi:MAG: DUF302 domain-containing protein [Rhodobacteraceae bacterium]|nr:DUF302 domain-containing protein [Paracoccaceae bacterium]